MFFKKGKICFLKKEKCVSITLRKKKKIGWLVFSKCTTFLIIYSKTWLFIYYVSFTEKFFTVLINVSFQIFIMIFHIS